MNDLIRTAHLLLAVFGVLIVVWAALRVCCAWLSLRERLADRRDERRERELIGRLAPAPDLGLQAGRDALAADLAITADEMHRLFPDIPREDQ